METKQRPCINAFFQRKTPNIMETKKGYVKKTTMEISWRAITDHQGSHQK